MDHYAEIFLDVPDNHGDLEPDALVFRTEDHAAGTVDWRVNDDRAGLRGLVYYTRQTPNTPEWEEQVKQDITEEFSRHTVRLLLPDGSDW